MALLANPAAAPIFPIPSYDLKTGTMPIAVCCTLGPAELIIPIAPGQSMKTHVTSCFCMHFHAFCIRLRSWLVPPPNAAINILRFVSIEHRD